MPSKEWLEKYEAMKEKLSCKKDLDAYFTEKEIGGMPIDTLEIGSVSFPTGEVVVCDPLVEFADARPYVQKIPSGAYPVTMCVVPSEKYGDRYACVKVAVSGEKPVRYELGLCGDEEFDELQDGEFFGFCVDGGMGCVADAKTQEAFKKYWEQRESEEEVTTTTSSATFLKETLKCSRNISAKAATGSTGPSLERSLTFQSSPPAGATAYIPSTSATTPAARYAASTSTSSTWKRNTKTTAGKMKRKNSPSRHSYGSA